MEFLNKIVKSIRAVPLDDRRNLARDSAIFIETEDEDTAFILGNAGTYVARPLERSFDQPTHFYQDQAFKIVDELKECLDDFDVKRIWHLNQIINVIMDKNYGPYNVLRGREI